MVSANVNKVLEETRQWTLDERRQLLALLSAGVTEAPLTDTGLDARLTLGGIRFTAPAQPTAEDSAQAEAWQPVAIQGKPLSQTIIEERR